MGRQAAPGLDIMPADSLIGDRVVNREGEDLGRIEEIMLEMENGRIAYAVLSFVGLMGMGDRLFAIPWNLLQLDTAQQRRFILNVARERLKTAPGFDKNDWPRMGDPEWSNKIADFYGQSVVWTRPGSDRRSNLAGRRVNDSQVESLDL
jgi:sporulation protein YlmC with PRC-barrel domain